MLRHYGDALDRYKLFLSFLGLMISKRKGMRYVSGKMKGVHTKGLMLANGAGGDIFVFVYEDKIIEGWGGFVKTEEQSDFWAKM